MRQGGRVYGFSLNTHNFRETETVSKLTENMF